MDSDRREADVDSEQLAQENAHGDPDRLPEGRPGLGSSDGEVPPDTIRGLVGKGVTNDEDDQTEREE